MFYLSYSGNIYGHSDVLSELFLISCIIWFIVDYLLYVSYLFSVCAMLLCFICWSTICRQSKSFTAVCYCFFAHARGCRCYFYFRSGFLSPTFSVTLMSFTCCDIFAIWHQRGVDFWPYYNAETTSSELPVDNIVELCDPDFLKKMQNIDDRKTLAADLGQFSLRMRINRVISILLF